MEFGDSWASQIVENEANAQMTTRDGTQNSTLWYLLEGYILPDGAMNLDIERKDELVRLGK